MYHALAVTLNCDMGQIHQHLVLFNYIAKGHEVLFLECINYLQQHFVATVRIENGTYVTSQTPGCSSDLKGVKPERAMAIQP